MPKFTAEETERREHWTRELFMKNPMISGPEMVKMIKKQFRSGMRMTRIYELRDEVLDMLGWQKDGRGNPLKPQNGFAEQAFRKEGENGTAKPVLVDPLFGRCVIPVEDVSDAVSFQQKLQFMNDKGFLTPKLKVEVANDHYVIVAQAK